jgi:AcrR family transcriptional regulator
MVASGHAADAEQSTRRRILAATFVVLARDGRRRLQLSDVAARAKVSRPTLYRYFGSKEGLLEAFGLYEQDNFDAGIATAIAGLSGSARLDAALRFIVDFQSGYSLGSLAEVEPEHVLQQMKRVLPIMRDRIARIIGGDQAQIAASAVVRIAVCHYVISDETPEGFLAELRHAAGLSRAALDA